MPEETIFPLPQKKPISSFGKLKKIFDKFTIFVLIPLLFLLYFFAWAPWITGSFAHSRALKSLDSGCRQLKKDEYTPEVNIAIGKIRPTLQESLGLEPLFGTNTSLYVICSGKTTHNFYFVSFLGTVTLTTTQPAQLKSDPTANWKTYANPEFGYSLKIPPEWKEVSNSSNDQKSFRFYVTQASSSDQIGSFEVELQVLTLAFDNPAFKGSKSDFEILKSTKDGTESLLNGRPFKKIRNIDLDSCIAPQLLFNEDSYKYGYSTGCSGEKRYISLLLLGDDLETIGKYKPLYDASLSTFQFNQFKL